jgi:hypothetical protein
MMRYGLDGSLNSFFRMGGFSKEYNASSGVRGTLVERVEVRETKIFPYSTKKRYE